MSKRFSGIAIPNDLNRGVNNNMNALYAESINSIVFNDTNIRDSVPPTKKYIMPLKDEQTVLYNDIEKVQTGKFMDIDKGSITEKSADDWIVLHVNNFPGAPFTKLGFDDWVYDNWGEEVSDGCITTGEYYYICNPADPDYIINWDGLKYYRWDLVDGGDTYAKHIITSIADYDVLVGLSMQYRANYGGAYWGEDCKLSTISIAELDYDNNIVDYTSRYADGHSLRISNVTHFQGLYFKSIGSNTIGMTHASGHSVNMYYSRNYGATWSSWAGSNISLSDGLIICFRGNNPNTFNNTQGKYSYFTISGSGTGVEAHGNIMSLIDNGACTKTDISTMTLGTFMRLFLNCSKLLTMPELPATILNDYCYQYMFNGCTSLLSVDTLPAILLANYCYNYMFLNCTSIVGMDIDGLPATTLTILCYANMFRGCTNLLAPPNLPATNMSNASLCYTGMFYGCTSLITPPELPATSLSSACYWQMFYNCTELKSAPILYAYTIPSNGYTLMFYNCHQINEIKCYAGSGTGTGNCRDWLYGVSSSGTFYALNNSVSWSTGTSGIPNGWTKNTMGPVVTILKTVNTTNPIILKCVSKSTRHTLLVSINGSSWTDIVANSEYSFSSRIIYLRGSLTGAQSSTNYTNIQIKSNNNEYFKLIGNCNAIWNYTNMSNGIRAYCGYHLFEGSTAIYEIDDNFLPMTTLANYCYTGMFIGCTSLISVPVLPATTLASNCYDAMFLNCTSIVGISANGLPAKTLTPSCYGHMFSGCTSLQATPYLPATTLANACYDVMFQNCTSLIYAPELPAITLSNSCYWAMFRGCTNLLVAPELPAPILTTSCYYNMFHNCTNLELAPELPAKSLANACYQGIFLGCSKINEVVCYADDNLSATNATTDWLTNTASSGTLYCKTNSLGNLPAGWNKVLFTTINPNEDNYMLIMDGLDYKHYGYNYNDPTGGYVGEYNGYVTVNAGEHFGEVDELSNDTVKMYGNPVVFIKNTNDKNYDGIYFKYSSTENGESIIDLGSIYDECLSYAENNPYDYGFACLYYTYTTFDSVVDVRFYVNYRLNLETYFTGFAIEVIDEHEDLWIDKNVIAEIYNSRNSNSFTFTPSGYPHMLYTANKFENDSNPGYNAFGAMGFSLDGDETTEICYRNMLDVKLLGDRFDRDYIYYGVPNYTTDGTGVLLFNYTFTGNLNLDDVYNTAYLNYCAGGDLNPMVADVDEYVQDEAPYVNDATYLASTSLIYGEHGDLYCIVPKSVEHDTTGPVFWYYLAQEEYYGSGHPYGENGAVASDHGDTNFNACFFSGWDLSLLSDTWQNMTPGSIVFRYNINNLQTIFGTTTLADVGDPLNGLVLYDQTLPYYIPIGM